MGSACVGIWSLGLCLCCRVWGSEFACNLPAYRSIDNTYSLCGGVFLWWGAGVGGSAGHLQVKCRQIGLQSDRAVS